MMDDKKMFALANSEEDCAKSLARARRMPSELQSLLNDQFMRELEAAYLYLSVANYFEAIGLGGFAAWMHKQSVEEHEHAMKIFKFMHDRGVEVQLAALAKPVSTFSSPLDAIERGLAQERFNTLSIKAVYSAAQKAEEWDLATFMSWFIDEQVEEENSFNQLASDLKRGQADTAVLFFLDREMAKR